MTVGAISQEQGLHDGDVGDPHTWDEKRNHSGIDITPWMQPGAVESMCDSEGRNTVDVVLALVDAGSIVGGDDDLYG